MAPKKSTRNNPGGEGGGSTGGGNNQRGNGNEGGNRGNNQQNAQMEQMFEFFRRNINRNQNVPPPNPPTQTAAAFKAFKSLQPPEFKGTADPVEARAWLKEMEKSFEIIDVEDEKKTIFAAYLLKGEANYWWEAKKALEGAGVVTWERFTELFLEKYFPDYMEGQMEIKFLEFKQNNLTIAEYEAKFAELSRFVPQWVDTDLKRARRFQYGLKPWIQKRVAPFEITEYTKMVQKAAIIEAGDDLTPRDKDSKKRKTEGWGGNSTGGTFQNQFNKKPGFQYGQNEGFKGRVSVNSGQDGQQGSMTQFRQPQPPLLDCETCGRKHTGVCMKTGARCFNCGQEGHYIKNCPKKRVVCYKCGKEGHISRDCRSTATRSVASRQSGEPNSNQPTARIFNMTVADGMREMDAIAGIHLLKCCKCYYIDRFRSS